MTRCRHCSVEFKRQVVETCLGGERSKCSGAAWRVGSKRRVLARAGAPEVRRSGKGSQALFDGRSRAPVGRAQSAPRPAFSSLAVHADRGQVRQMAFRCSAAGRSSGAMGCPFPSDAPVGRSPGRCCAHGQCRTRAADPAARRLLEELTSANAPAELDELLPSNAPRAPIAST